MSITSRLNSWQPYRTLGSCWRTVKCLEKNQAEMIKDMDLMKGKVDHIQEVVKTMTRKRKSFDKALRSKMIFRSPSFLPPCILQWSASCMITLLDIIPNLCFWDLITNNHCLFPNQGRRTRHKIRTKLKPDLELIEKESLRILSHFQCHIVKYFLN